MGDLKPVYQASTLELAVKKLNDLKLKWGDKYPIVINSWEKNWTNLTAYFEYTQPIRTLIYTMYLVEVYILQLRKVTKTRSIFPNDDALLKLLYLATQDISKKWTMPRRDWAQTIAQLSIHFPGRVPIDL
jgi:transposase-like protein